MPALSFKKKYNFQANITGDAAMMKIQIVYCTV